MLLHETLMRQAAQRPDAVALVSGHQTLTYGELDALSTRIAYALIGAGCRRGDRVALLLPKSVQAIAGMLGTLKAGGVYVPTDTRSPAARLARIVNVSDPSVILVAGEGAALLDGIVREHGAGKSAAVGWLDAEPPSAPLPVAFRAADLEALPSDPVEVALAPDAPAHILFTSGSTGMPKGVVITHANVMHFITWATRYFGTQATDRISCHPPLHFDLSTFDVYGTFLAGAELHLVPHDASLMPHKLAEFIRRSRLTQWFSVPSVLRFMAQFDVIRHGDFPEMQRLLWCGEALPTPTLRHWMQRLPHVSFTNLYGPTETTIASSYYRVPRCPESDTTPIPIGTACEGEVLMVLDEALTPVPPGEIGDLYIRGVGLSPGYWRDDEKTRAVFVTDADGARMYKTGDLARAGEDGLIYLLGRTDSQIKSRGYRIELGEIEAALAALGTVRECAVVAAPSTGFEGVAICCAYVPAPGSGTGPAELREQLAAVLPSYMLPARWMSFDALPLNGNGKIDRPRLREQFLADTASA